MDHSFSLDIIVFAVIAAVLLFRLRKVFGERSDGEPPGFQSRGLDPAALLKPRPPETPERDAAVPRLIAARQGDGKPADKNQSAPSATSWTQDLPDYDTVLNATAHHRLLPLAAIDPDFQPQAFLQGARRAYEIVVLAFAKGELARLEPLLTPDLFEVFQSDVAQRQADGTQLQLLLQAIRQAVISDATLDGTRAYVTVDFVTEQSITRRDANGQIEDGLDGTPRTVRERWIFTNDLQDDETLWRLSDTDDLDD